MRLHLPVLAYMVTACAGNQGDDLKSQSSAAVSVPVSLADDVMPDLEVLQNADSVIDALKNDPEKRGSQLLNVYESRADLQDPLRKAVAAELMMRKKYNHADYFDLVKCFQEAPHAPHLFKVTVDLVERDLDRSLLNGVVSSVYEGKSLPLQGLSSLQLEEKFDDLHDALLDKAHVDGYRTAYIVPRWEGSEKQVIQEPLNLEGDPALSSWSWEPKNEDIFENNHYRIIDAKFSDTIGKDIDRLLEQMSMFDVTDINDVFPENGMIQIFSSASSLRNTAIPAQDPDGMAQLLNLHEERDAAMLKVQGIPDKAFRIDELRVGKDASHFTFIQLSALRALHLREAVIAYFSSKGHSIGKEKFSLNYLGSNGDGTSGAPSLLYHTCREKMNFGDRRTEFDLNHPNGNKVTKQNVLDKYCGVAPSEKNKALANVKDYEAYKFVRLNAKSTLRKPSAEPDVCMNPALESNWDLSVKFGALRIDCSQISEPTDQTTVQVSQKPKDKIQKFKKKKTHYKYTKIKPHKPQGKKISRKNKKMQKTCIRPR